MKLQNVKLFFLIVLIIFSLTSCRKDLGKITEQEKTNKQKPESEEEKKNFSNGKNIFNSKEMHVIKFTSNSPNTWANIISNYNERIQNVDKNKNNSKKNAYVSVNVEIDGNLVNSVGLRIKGNRLSNIPGNPKYESLKIDFDRFVKKQKYDGLKKLNIKNRNIVANHLLYKLALDNNIPSCRTSFAKVFFDSKYIGSYLLIEQIDKTYLKQNFKDKSGNLYKASGKGAHLEYLGANKDSYVYAYEKKTNKKSENYTDLINLLNFFSKSKTPEFEQRISTHLNIDNFIKALAIEMICSKTDAFYDAGRNFYLYNNPKKSQFEYIVDDFDYTMSSTHSIDLNFKKINNPFQPYVGSPIITQIFKSTSLKAKYYQTVTKILNNGFKNLTKEVDAIEALANKNNFNLYDLLDRRNTSASIKTYINSRISELNAQLKKN